MENTAERSLLNPLLIADRIREGRFLSAALLTAGWVFVAIAAFYLAWGLAGLYFVGTPSLFFSGASAGVVQIVAGTATGIVSLGVAATLAHQAEKH